jgi:hypothetical protein
MAKPRFRVFVWARWRLRHGDRKKSERKSGVRYYQNMEVHSFRIAALALSCASLLAAQPVDDTKVKQVIILGRHGVRSPVVDNSTLNNFSTQQFRILPGQ